MEILPKFKDGILRSSDAISYGRGNLPAAKLVIIVEGQWDAICLGSDLRWLANDTSWPEKIVVMGMRGKVIPEFKIQEFSKITSPGTRIQKSRGESFRETDICLQHPYYVYA